MKQTAIYPILLCLLLLFTVLPLQAQDLLNNPGFEDPFIISGDDPPREVANGWSRWNISAPADAPSYINREPEYYPAARAEANRVRSGENAQLILSFYASHIGGVYQTVSGVTPGSTLRFSVYAYIWSSSFDEADLSEADGDVTVSVGIDPTGGTNGEAASIIWSEPGQVYDSYNEYSVEATANGEIVTVFIRTTVGTPVKHNNIYLDDASLTVADQAGAPGETTEEVAMNPTVETTQEVGVTVTAATTEEIAVTETEEMTAPDIATATETTIAVATATEIAPTADTGVTVTEESQPLPTEPSATPTVEAPAATQVEPTATAIEMATETATPTTSDEVPATPLPTAAPPDQVTNTITHTVERGETVARLAERYGSTIDAIRQANGLDANYLIFIGQELIIPVSPDSPTAIPGDSVVVVTATPVGSTPSGGGMVTYTVLEGDSLSRIARLFNTSVAAIAQLNGIVSGSQLQVGQQLTIPRGQAQAQTVVTPQRTYTVLPGDTLYRISLRFGVSIGRIAEANNIINLNRIYIGQRLIIP
ncbi:MAG: LysM peptidoglycan-binding domain-containing protein [Anaerolineae bacterium]|nr:LysM peptidoglycan-binding domain-containing protein [Anaerolineae bacterium]